MQLADLITRLATTTLHTYSQAEVLVAKGLALGLSVEDMASFNEELDAALICAAVGISVEQMHEFYADDTLPLLAGAVRYGLVPEQVSAQQAAGTARALAEAAR